MWRAKRTDSEILATITGLLIPADWDEKGNIIAAVISTYSEEEYLIDQDAKNEELLTFLRQRVKASGLVREDEHGNKMIAVKRYEILKV